MDDLFQTIFVKEHIAEEDETARNICMYGTLFFSVVAAMLTALNIYKAYWFMTGTTLVLVFGFLYAFYCAKVHRIMASRVVAAVMCGIIFSVYAITGENDGFAILWIILVPIISSFLTGLKIGCYLGIYFQIFLIVLFYTPIYPEVRNFYTPTFCMRFPLLYFASFGAITFLMCQRQMLYDEIHHHAYYDALTNLHNRRYYHEMKVQYTGPQLTIVAFDLNRLKYANDTWGHEAGDEILRAAAQMIAEAFAGDDCCRIGGDEFAVLSIRKKASVLQSIAEFKEKMANWRGVLVPSINISVGYCSRQDYPTFSFEELARAADHQMYEEKARYYSEQKIDRRSR